MVEFIGSGKSSRALIRKGKLHFVERQTAAGHAFTVFDENRKPCPDAALWLAGHHYEADAEGVITVPYSTNPGEQTMILNGGDRVALGVFYHHAEQYRLAPGFTSTPNPCSGRNRPTS